MNPTQRQPTVGLDLAAPHLAAFIDNSLDFFCIASIGGDMSFLNRAGRSLIGLADDAPFPSHLTDYLPESGREAFMRTVLPHLRSEGRWEGDLTLQRVADGRAVSVHARVFYLQQAQTGRRVSIAAICRDIGPAKLAEEQLRAAENALTYATRLNSMGEITASIAHEVSQPLGAILSHGNACLRWLTAAKLDIGEARTAAVRIVRDANRASLILERIRELSKPDVHEWMPFNINDTLRGVMELLNGEIRQHEIDCTLELDEDLPSTRGDDVQLQQVVLNLVMNAIEALRCVNDRKRTLVLSTVSVVPQFVEIRIRDSGAGIAESHVQQVFEPFFTTKPQGMGLGLSIARRSVGYHGGVLRLLRNPDHGVTVAFTLPTRRESAM